MIGKPQTVSHAKIRKTIGRLDDQMMLGINRTLAVFLGYE
jgi:mRNA-degrading endonuclease toxin of MazEF toxin-antitoxin module